MCVRRRRPYEVRRNCVRWYTKSNELKILDKRKEILKRGGTTMEHIIVLFILALCFFSFFYFLYHVLVKLQNKENFSDEYKLMVASCVVFVFILLF